jgi:hypothetical protein
MVSKSKDAGLCWHVNWQRAESVRAGRVMHVCQRGGRELGSSQRPNLRFLLWINLDKFAMPLGNLTGSPVCFPSVRFGAIQQSSAPPRTATDDSRQRCCCRRDRKGSEPHRGSCTHSLRGPGTWRKPRSAHGSVPPRRRSRSGSSCSSSAKHTQQQLTWAARSHNGNQPLLVAAPVPAADRRPTEPIVQRGGWRKGRRHQERGGHRAHHHRAAAARPAQQP